MNIKFQILSLGVTLLLVGASTGIGQTTNAIAINNYSFENPSGLADGNYETTSLPGWGTPLSGSAVYAVINPGTTGTSEPWPSSTPPGLDGTNFCQIFAYRTGGSGIVYQDTGVKYQAGVNYALTAALGLQTNSTFGTNSIMALYNSSLTPISSVVINPANLIRGAFTDQSLTYAGTGSEASGSGADGTAGDILVGFAMPASTASDPSGQTYFDFDNVRLTAVYPAGVYITSEPASQTTYLGQTNSFSVTATGSGTLHYQWQATNSASGGFTNLVNGGPVSGVNSNVLTIAGVTANWVLSYQVIVTNATGCVTSSPPAVLTLLPGSPPFRLMPLGDSITRGATDPNYENNISIASGFRDAIYTLSTNGNVNLQLVGATASQASPQLVAAGQQYHNGYGSYTTGDLFSNLTANVPPPYGDSNVGGYWMTSGSPGGAPVLEDVVILLTGANDIYWNGNNGLQVFTNNELNLLGWFKTNRPNTKVIVATDIPRNDSYSNQVLLVNQWITNTVQALSTNFSTIDMYHLFIDGNGAWKTTSSSDGICLQDAYHPSHNGYQAMGQVWFNAIQGVMNPTAPNYLSATGGINSQVYLAWTNVPGALGYNVKMSLTNGGLYTLIASNISATSFTNNGLNNGTAYYYVVSALFSGGEGPNSYQVNATPGTIPIVNHSFDNNYVPYASFIGSAPSGWTFNGTGNGQLAAVVFPESGDSRFSSYPVPGLDGLDYAQIFVYGTSGSGSMYINTGYNYVAGATYTLTAGFGVEAGTLASGAEMMLQNPTFTTLASTNITTANTTANQFKDVSTTYTANGTEGNIVINFAIPAAVAGNAFFDIDNVRLTVVYPSSPVITTQPVSQANGLGSTVSFNVSASGPSSLSYQWQASGGTGFTNLVNNGNISGATSNVLTIASVSTNSVLAYRVVVANSYGSVTSSVANLTVLPGTVVPILNPNFDVDTIIGGNAPAYQIVTPTGWTAIGTNPNNLIGLISPANSTSYPATFTGSSPPNAFFSFSSDGNANPGVSQTLTTLLNSNTTYTLSVQVGNRNSGTWGGYHILLETTNGTVVGDWVGVYNNVAAPGTFATTAKSYTTGPNPPGLGQPLVIVLEQAVPAAGSYSDFDSVSLLATPVAPRAQGAPIDVYVCSGQSNCHGWYANVAALSQGNQHYANAPDARVLSAYQCALVGAASYSTGSMGQLAPEGAGHVSNFTGFGPELSAGSDLAARFGRPLAVIKFASGGANLDAQFRKAANYLYPLMIAKITNSLQQLTAQGYTPTLKGFFWLQGETDAGANPTTYTNDIAQFVSDLRNDLQVTNLEFVLTEINSNMPNFAAQQTGVAQVNGGMLALVNSDPNVKYVTTHDITNGFADNAVHYSADQTVTIGQRWAAAYTVTTSPISTNASLTSLVVNPVLSFTPAFSSSTLSYAATAAYGSTPTVTVTNADLTATNQLIYNGATNVIASGAASPPLLLNANPAATNLVTVRVTAQDGVTVKNYTVNLIRLPNLTSQPGLTNSVNNGLLNLKWGLDRLGYRLLTQTNNLNLGVSVNLNDWATVPGSTTTNQITLPITTTNFDAYYRLVYP